MNTLNNYAKLICSGQVTWKGCFECSSTSHCWHRSLSCFIPFNSCIPFLHQPSRYRGDGVNTWQFSFFFFSSIIIYWTNQSKADSWMIFCDWSHPWTRIYHLLVKTWTGSLPVGMLGDLQAKFSSVTGRGEFTSHIWILGLREVCVFSWGKFTFFIWILGLSEVCAVFKFYIAKLSPNCRTEYNTIKYQMSNMKQIQYY